MQWLMPSEGGFLEAEGLEKTWRIKQDAIASEVDILSSRNQYDIILPGPSYLIAKYEYLILRLMSLLWY